MEVAPAPVPKLKRRSHRAGNGPAVVIRATTFPTPGFWVQQPDGTGTAVGKRQAGAQRPAISKPRDFRLSSTAKPCRMTAWL